MDYLPPTLCSDSYSEELTLGPRFQADHANIQVGAAAWDTTPCLYQVAQGKPGDYSWTLEREFTAVPQVFKIANIVGVRFRNQTPGKQATVSAYLLGPKDPDIQPGTPFGRPATLQEAVGVGAEADLLEWLDSQGTNDTAEALWGSYDDISDHHELEGQVGVIAGPQQSFTIMRDDGVSSFLQISPPANYRFRGYMTRAAFPPALPQNGDTVYVLEVDGSVSLYIYDQASTAWVAVASDASTVKSFNGRQGAVVPAAGDYTAAMVTNAADKASAAQQSFVSLVQAHGLHVNNVNFGGLGYTTGAGGFIIIAAGGSGTLNTYCGQVEASAPVPTGTTAFFTVKSSVVAAGDTIVVSVANCGSLNVTARVTNVAAGQFTIAFSNSAGSSLQAIFNFAVIKTATS